MVIIKVLILMTLEIFPKDIIDGKINNFNKQKKYNEKFKDIEKNLENKKKC